jgi:hypothetical protein
LICSGKLDDGRITPSDGAAFSCAKHGDYAVARTALARFEQMTFQLQEAALERAKVFVGSRNGEVIVTSMDL